MLRRFWLFTQHRAESPRGFSTIWTVVAIVAVIVVVVGLTGLPNAEESVNVDEDVADINTEITDPTTRPSTKVLLAQELSDSSADFQFSAEIPPTWQAEAVKEIAALNIYDPAAAGENTLAQSQIFLRSFTANDFLTLSTVTIHSREELTVVGRPAVRYDIEKKAGVGNFPAQPAWRNQRHMVTDVRVSDDSPSVFYVIAKHPDLDQSVYDRFLESLVVDTAALPTAHLLEPIEQFRDRITLKHFGQYITAQNSPVQPERFSGFHTAVDVEFGDTDDIPIPVRAIGPGEIILSRTASGYGGVFVLRFQWQSETYTAVYGHIAPDSLPRLGAQVLAGQELGYLGKGGTSETDGERKHLHFGIHLGSVTDIAGYVQSEAALTPWVNPLAL
ncbi:MAG: M23 family metallopeptidase [Candidatus Nomurabacteria bacterium]|nr:MAG: M23 family metallopeptidase [Candidatus Nomurabacteria bacterium]